MNGKTYTFNITSPIILTNRKNRHELVLYFTVMSFKMSYLFSEEYLDESILYLWNRTTPSCKQSISIWNVICI